MPDTTAFRPIHQRARGRAELVLTPATTGARIAHLYQRRRCACCSRRATRASSTLGVLVNVGGGLAGGDRLGMALTLKPQARFTLTTPAAEKIYRSLGEETQIDLERGGRGRRALRMAAAGDHPVRRRAPGPPPGGLRWSRCAAAGGGDARVRPGRTRREVHPGRVRTAGGCVAVARCSGPIRCGWRIRPGPALASRFAMGQAGAVATAPARRPGRRRTMRELARELAAGGASLVAPELLLARWLGEAGAVRRAWGRALAMRSGRPPRPPPHLPRLWRAELACAMLASPMEVAHEPDAAREGQAARRHGRAWSRAGGWSAA